MTDRVGSVNILLPTVLAVAPVFGLNVTAYAFGIVFAASFGMSCPLAGSHSVLIMQAGYKFRDFFHYGALLDLLDLLNRMNRLTVRVVRPQMLTTRHRYTDIQRDRRSTEES